MTLADQAAMTGQDGHVASRQPGRPARRTFTAAYKVRILAAYDALPEGSPERGALMRREKLYHSHIEHWRKQQENGTLASSAGKQAKGGESAELARLRAENKKLKVRNERLAGELGKTRTALGQIICLRRTGLVPARLLSGLVFATGRSPHAGGPRRRSRSQ